MIPTPETTPPGPGHVPPEVSMTGSAGLWHGLDTLKIGLAFTTYQPNRLFLLGRKPAGRLAVNERLFEQLKWALLGSNGPLPPDDPG